MHFPTAILGLGSLLIATTSASTAISFSAPDSSPGTAAAPQVSTTILYETSTYYLTSALTLTVPVATPVPIEPANNSSCTTNDAIPTPEPEAPVVVSGNVTLVPVTLWEGTTTRVVYPQNSTAIAYPTMEPNDTTTAMTTAVFVGTSTVVNTTVVSASKTAAGSSSSTDETSATASVSEVPVNGAEKSGGNVVLGLGVVAGLMALL